MSEDQEAQEDELLALASIYDQEEFQRHDSARGGQVRICPDLPPDFKVSVKAGGRCADYGVSFLPPLVLNFELPADYPSTSSPLFTLNCKWLSEVQIAAVCRHLDKLWQESLGSVVLFSWIQFLREDVLSFLQISSSLELPSQWDGDNAQAHKEGAGHGAWAGLHGPGPATRADSNAELLLQLLDFDRAQRHKEFDNQLFDCGICFSKKLGANCFSFRECKHVYCTECTRGYFQVLIRDGAVDGLKCPQSDCGCEATPMQVKQLVGEELFGRYDRLLLQSSLDGMADVTYCPRHTCATAVLVEQDSPSAICTSCRYAFCTLCRQGYHGLSRCAEKGARGEAEPGTGEPYAPVPKKEDGLRGLWDDYDTGSKTRRKFLEKRYGRSVLQNRVEYVLTESWLDTNTKKCPHCQATIQKDGGCNRVLCSKCHHYFCWVCLRQDKISEHFSDPASPCSQSYYHQ
ncbi:E3 ubiquitin-protein ligase RNF14-like isoform X1 [Anguilla anguilla]|uniref:E3 ubiquitin-protein ligase RNF14-like isoform X1 n=1 Tax=Anguilla anguilla TaxID=7936 RepID=UPI0015ADF0B4|nr:E3 ubiquitin-protein ligase RNF14-like isoform X1 [Anguilla anguilla]XP_035271918.1 E3 ubiquitin-protein ligase RNF14-like isoform X1 [Anguilla anguilla]